MKYKWSEVQVKGVVCTKLKPPPPQGASWVSAVLQRRRWRWDPSRIPTTAALAAKITNLQPWSQSLNPGTNGPPASTTSPPPLSFLRPLPPRAAAAEKDTAVCVEVDQGWTKRPPHAPPVASPSSGHCFTLIWFGCNFSSKGPHHLLQGAFPTT